MAQVTLRINGYAHALHCADGEEEHLRAMGAEVDARITSLRQAGLAGGEARMLVVAALQLADELSDAKRALGREGAAPSGAPSELAASLAALAARIGRVAEHLEREAGPEPALETAGESA
jgi:cell division protein ZapA